jgi:hypothetical protein
MRFWFSILRGLRHPQGRCFARVRRWRDACLAHLAAQQVSHDEIVKLYYDYAVGAGNGALPEGGPLQLVSIRPARPPHAAPRDKYDRIATDADSACLETHVDQAGLIERCGASLSPPYSSKSGVVAGVPAKAL